ncbi:hypothetical protein T4D_1516 [Trichinella pseudospiralis]|uniref:Uncharacterized protein n=1 Tax=Trichinella pseudospiralis TaxID=6337 RepID=A0A0V1FN87_TRIPS|nr:hypothetical protein T4D_1516 [Trichinella pseudospiralis]
MVGRCFRNNTTEQDIQKTFASQASFGCCTITGATKTRENIAHNSLKPKLRCQKWEEKKKRGTISERKARPHPLVQKATQTTTSEELGFEMKKTTMLSLSLSPPTPPPLTHHTTGLY